MRDWKHGEGKGWDSHTPKNKGGMESALKTPVSTPDPTSGRTTLTRTQRLKFFQVVSVSSQSENNTWGCVSIAREMAFPHPISQTGFFSVVTADSELALQPQPLQGKGYRHAYPQLEEIASFPS